MPVDSFSNFDYTVRTVSRHMWSVPKNAPVSALQEAFAAALRDWKTLKGDSNDFGKNAFVTANDTHVIFFFEFEEAG